MNREIFRKLQSPFGQEVLQAALDLEPLENDFLHHFNTLSRRYPTELARAALEIAILRREGAIKFPFAGSLYFTRSALEQASNYEVSTYRAERYNGFDRLLDLGCSIGGDTLALARVVHTFAVDLDPLRLAMAQANLRAMDLLDRVVFIQADLNSPIPYFLSHGSALFFDPARRTQERRIFSVLEYRPPLTVIQNWLPQCHALGVKISPGVNLDELHAYDAEVEFVSLRGNLKEAVLWFGPLKTSRRRATVLPGRHTLTAPPDFIIPNKVPFSEKARQHEFPLSDPGAFLYEPDPSVLRAGLVQVLGEQLGAAQLDPDIAYLTSDRLIDTPFARAWAVESWLPFGIKRLRAVLRQRGVGQVMVKKRGSPIQPEALIHALHLKAIAKPGQIERVLFLTHLRGQPIVIICFP